MNNCRQNLENFDPEVFGHLNDEIKRQEEHIELIASENFVSKAVLETMQIMLTFNLTVEQMLILLYMLQF